MQHVKPSRFLEFWMRLTPRERTMLSSLVMVAFAVAAMVLFVMRSRAIDERRGEITKARQALELVYAKGAVYQESRKRKRDREARISSEEVLFSTLLEEAAALVEGVAVSNQEELAPIDLAPGLRRRSVEFDLRNVTLEQLTKFLASIESKPGHIIFTDRIRIRSGSASEDRLTVDAEVATWQRVEQQPTEEVAQ